ncbi:TetR/AcrR family transcriptional regulator [Pontibacter sp. G13]|uniref:TetR/AcrR family transcriptional regulator n=1 Tax=Pontibacter sp. G13 TaxID=3074898 RepID=UPI002889394B|nr:TetR/AcrR family transcriptional regulator [Pontibacter sp. G13]WNJ20294.1 TetR/AcrR family transcriptional regulator [Pontibacter sp. G13]
MSKRTEILKTAKAIFNKYGFKRVSIEEICTQAGVSRMTFYRAFSNKTALVIAVITEMFETEMAETNALIAGSQSLADQLHIIFERKVSFSESLSEDFTRDVLLPANTEIEAHLAQLIRRKTEWMMALIRAGQSRGEIDPHLNLDLVPTLFDSYMDTAHKIKASGDRVSEQINALAGFFIRSLGIQEPIRPSV